MQRVNQRETAGFRAWQAHFFKVPLNCYIGATKNVRKNRTFFNIESLFLIIVRGKAENRLDRGVFRAREDKNNPDGLFLPQAA